MATVRRANVILDIADDEAVIDKYLSMGYDLLGEHGKVERKATSGKSEGELRQEIEELQAEVKRLRLQVKKLKEAAPAAPAVEEKPKPVVKSVEKVEKSKPNKKKAG